MAFANTATVTPSTLEITCSTIFPGDGGEVMVTSPAFGSAAPGGVTMGDEMVTTTCPPVAPTATLVYLIVRTCRPNRPNL